LPEAASLLQAAWDLDPHGVLAFHVAAVLEASGETDRAADYFALALSGDRPDVEAAPRLQKLIADPRARNGKVTAAPAQLAAARTVTVPKIPGVTGRADAFIRIGAAQTIEDVRFISGDATMRPEVEMLRTVKAPSRLPSATSVRLIRRGTLTCEPTATACSLVLSPASRVTPN
jgi:hypothetical protein